MEALQRLVLESEEKLMKMSRIVTSFSSDESVRPPTLLKMGTTIDILIDYFYQFQESYFNKEQKRLLLSYKKDIFEGKLMQIWKPPFVF